MMLRVTPDDPTPRSGESRPKGKGARTRQAILDAAGRIFHDRPVYSVTVDEIAEAAGVSVGTLYKYFPSKPAILLAFVSDGIDVVEGYMEQARALPTALERVYAAGDAYVRFAVERPDAVRYAAARALAPDPSPELADINEQIAARIQNVVMGIAVDLKEAMNLGQTPVAPIDETMIFLWSLWNGMTALIVRQDGAAIPVETAQRSLELARETMRRAAAHYEEHPEPFPSPYPPVPFGLPADGCGAPT